MRKFVLRDQSTPEQEIAEVEVDIVGKPGAPDHRIRMKVNGAIILSVSEKGIRRVFGGGPLSGLATDPARPHLVALTN